MDIGIHSFAAMLPDPVTGAAPDVADRVAGLLEEIEHGQDGRNAQRLSEIAHRV